MKVRHLRMMPGRLLALQFLLQLQIGLAQGTSTGFTVAYTDHASRLRADLLRDYDSVVPPRSERDVDYSKAGTDVALEIRIFKVQGVDASLGQMRLKVWVRMSWTDTRLSWDPAAYGNITTTHFRTQHASNAENTEIWLPDVQLYNANVGNEFSLDSALASVTSDGFVFWSRPGLLDTLCKFSGLVAFPFDELSCAMEWGGWTYSGGFQGIRLNGKGYSASTSEDTAGSSYQEYRIVEIDVEAKTNFYEAYPSEPWTVLKFTVRLGRASFYYSLLIVFPTVLITYLSFGVFFMSHEVGERLSFGITLLLVIEVMKTTGASFVPVCGELLWIDLFMLVNTVFCCASLVETMAVLFFAFHVDQHILPNWLAWAAPWCLCRRQPNFMVESNAGRIFRQLNRDRSARLQAKSTKNLQKGRRIEELSEAKLTETDTERLIFFENLFYLLDSDSNGLITAEDAACMLSFVNLSLSRGVLEDILQSAWQEKKLFDCRDFLEICVELMWSTPFKEIKLGAENYISSQTRHTKRCHTYWLKWSRTVDKWSRFWLPLLYTIALGFLLNLELTDYYDDQAGSEMFQGFGPMSMSTPGLIQALITPIIGVVSILTWLQMRRLSKQWRKQQKAAMKARDLEPEDSGRAKPRWTLLSEDGDVYGAYMGEVYSERVLDERIEEEDFQDVPISPRPKSSW
eukprot:s2955_g4.t1